jgi:hypothetical protein
VTAFTMSSVLPVLIVMMPSLLRCTHMMIAAQLHEKKEEAAPHGCCSRMLQWHSPAVEPPPGVVDHVRTRRRHGPCLTVCGVCA